jgi:hypothetical protein
MPHSGPRGWPVTDWRHADTPDRMTAPAIVQSGETLMGRPLMVSVMDGGMVVGRGKAASGQAAARKRAGR